MKKKSIVTNTYLLQSDKEDNKGFGYVQGVSYLPDYDTKIKVYIRDDKFEIESDIHNMQLLTLNAYELESINKAIQFIDNSLKTLISLAHRNLLKDEAFIEEEE
ncbi:hypothetical protein ADH76_11495 [Enterocloster clostridioformis]|uniref:hypothetical protein n=1 Tax=Bacteroides acidifaciens TaxID=85831 RepID=UPI00080C86AF|nr:MULTISPECIES: hypothetical protein [Bacteria]ANU48264.1 hypothetical protein A4V08_23115 [Lachnoclostridium sp. YL32]NDO29489.1 hypothetical protein [Enterocloster clostridioformis]OXE69028.1 hypothetical protein ADH76_11495 [Enterocloster clostridioformis]QQR02848.1 hypothetical protein I5Q83_11695 [Enterocloster clostridioformis]